MSVLASKRDTGEPTATRAATYTRSCRRRKARLWTCLVLSTGVWVACGEGEAPGAGEASLAEPSEPRRHERVLWYVSTVNRAAIAAVFEFDVVRQATESWHRSRVWLARDGGWTVLMDTLWNMALVPEPFQLMPHGPLRLLVNNTGGIEALIHGSGADEVRLAPGRTLAVHRVGRGEALISEAELRLGGEPSPGLVLDMHWVGPVPAPTDSSARSRQLLASDGEGVHVFVWTEPAGGVRMWIHAHGEGSVLDDAVLRSQPAPPPGETASAVVSWVVEAAAGNVVLELDPTNGWSDAGPPGYYRVTGGLTLAGERLPIAGMVRDVAPRTP